MKKFLVFVAIIIMMGLIIVIGCQIAVTSAAKGRMYNDVKEIPHREVGLLLGTSPLGRSGRPNQFYLHRLDATVALYNAGKIDRIIISGARRGDDYDEPTEMRNDLVKRGLPDSIFVLDGEGHRTISSIVRTKEVLAEDSVTIISQKFHNERALFLARHNEIDAIAFNAENTSSRRWRLMMVLRESLARVKAVAEAIFG